jgi:hypothetical protein
VGRAANGRTNTWAIYTAAVGGGFGVPANSFSVWQYPSSNFPGCCLNRFTILASSPADTVNTVTINGEGDLLVPGYIFGNSLIHTTKNIGAHRMLA